MSILREKPYTGMNFVVDLGEGQVDGTEAGLLEVVLPEARLQVNEYRNGNDKANEPTKVNSLTHYGNLVLKRGAIGSLTWYHWWNEARNGGQATRTVTVQLLDEERNSVLAWKFLRARPVGYRHSPLNAPAAEILIESLELAFDRMEME